MSKYTTELRFICEMKSGLSTDTMNTYTPDEIIAASREKIFNFSYPIYDETHKPELETKILKHYYTREIGCETVGLWQLWLNERLNLIMPKYNKLYEAEKILFNKGLNNIDVTTQSLRTDDLLRTDDFTRTDDLNEQTSNLRTDNLNEQTSNLRTDNLNEQTSNLRTDNLQSQTVNNLKETRKFSDTPQGSITFNELNEENYWLTDYTETENGGTVTSTDTGTQNNTGTRTNTGTQNNAGTRTNTGTQNNAGTRTNTGTQNNAGTSANTGTVENQMHEVGYRGSKMYFELMQEYEKNIYNIDRMIINELKDLFFNLW